MTRFEICQVIRKRAVNMFRRPDLAELCGICSTALYFAFDKLYDVELWYGHFEKDHHCWIESGVKIWDITATQFGNYPEIWTPKICNNIYKHIFKINAKNYHSFFVDWPEDQQPTSTILENLIGDLKC